MIIETYEYVKTVLICEWMVEAVPHLVIPLQEPQAARPRMIIMLREPRRYGRSDMLFGGQDVKSEPETLIINGSIVMGEDSH